MHSVAFEFALLYLTVGVAIGAATALRNAPRETPALAALGGGGLAAIAFWPLFLPFLLGAPGERSPHVPAAEPEAGALVRALRRTQRSLDDALGGIEGREALGLAVVLTRMPEVMRTLEEQARSVEDMARVLATPPPDADDALDPDLARDLGSARAASDRRLRALHDRRREELLRAIVRLEELVSMIHLARFAREPNVGAGPLVQQITATVEALSELSTEDPS